MQRGGEKKLPVRVDKRAEVRMLGAVKGPVEAGDRWFTEQTCWPRDPVRQAQQPGVQGERRQLFGLLGCYGFACWGRTKG